MSALLDEFRSVLSSYRNEVATWVNQGLLVSVDEHLKRLEAAAPTVEADARAAVHQILTDLYTAWHAPAQDPATPEEPTPAPADEAAPVLATGGTISGPVLVDESGPETVSLPDGAPVAAAPAENTTPDVPDAAPAIVAEPETDTPATTES